MDDSASKNYPQIPPAAELRNTNGTIVYALVAICILLVLMSGVIYYNDKHDRHARCVNQRDTAQELNNQGDINKELLITAANSLRANAKVATNPQFKQVQLQFAKQYTEAANKIHRVKVPKC